MSMYCVEKISTEVRMLTSWLGHENLFNSAVQISCVSGVNANISLVDQLGAGLTELASKQ